MSAFSARALLSGVRGFEQVAVRAGREKSAFEPMVEILRPMRLPFGFFFPTMTFLLIRNPGGKGTANQWRGQGRVYDPVLSPFAYLQAAPSLC
jgi:hypothetical protein